LEYQALIHDKTDEHPDQKGIITQEAKELEQEIQAEEKQQEASTAAKIKEETAKVQKIPEWTKKIEVGAKDGAYIKTADDRFSMKFNFGLEPLFIYSANEDAEDSTTFRIRRARLYVTAMPSIPGKYLTNHPGSSSVNIRVPMYRYYWTGFSLNLASSRSPMTESILFGFALQFIERSIASNSPFSATLGAVFRHLLCQPSGVYSGGI
jgi:hypothetical protein